MVMYIAHRVRGKIFIAARGWLATLRYPFVTNSFCAQLYFYVSLYKSPRRPLNPCSLPARRPGLDIPVQKSVQTDCTTA